MTWDMGHIEEGEHLSQLQLPSSYGLGVTVFGRYFYKESLSTEGVCRTALATPGFVTISLY